MTSATIERLQQQIQQARLRGDGREVARLRFELPLEIRNAEKGAGWTIAAGRQQLPIPQIKDSASRSSVNSSGWPASIRMSESVLRQIRSIDFDGREEAGFLIGSTDSGEVIDYFLSHDEDSQTWRSVKLDLDHALSVLAGLPLDRTIVGELHTHPNGVGVEASSQDIAAAACMAEGFRRPEWVSLIVSGPAPENRYATTAEVGAYLVRPDGNRRTVSIDTRSN